MERRRSRTWHLWALLALAALPATASAAAIDFSRTQLNGFHAPFSEAASPQLVVVTNVGNDPLQIGNVNLTGSQAANFTLNGRCAIGNVTLKPGERCLVEIVFQAFASSSANLVINSNAPGSPHSLLLSGRLAETAVGVPYALATFTPPYLDFGAQATGSPTTAWPIALASAGRNRAFAITGIGVGGRHPGDFTVTSTCQAGAGLPVGGGCTFAVVFAPSAPGPRSAEIYIKEATQAVAFPLALAGVGGVAGPSVPVTVVEYYNASLDHYFITWVVAEQAILDAGNTPTRWLRTGASFKAYSTLQTGTSTVCRYYIPSAKGDSHFFGRGLAECNATGLANPSFVQEEPNFMRMFLPTAGVCPAGTMPIYRVFSNRADANHRYMTERATRDQMTGRGWLAEGDGPDLVVMCAPQ